MHVVIVDESIQDAIEDMEALNPTAAERGTIIVPPGRYPERVTDNLSHVDVVAQIAGTAVIEAVSSGTGGSYRVGIDAETGGPVEVIDKLLCGLRIIRNDPGGSVSQPPEAALYVGNPEAVVGLCDNIIIDNCIVEGVHDSVQCSGLFDDDPETIPGLIIVQNCIIRCVHDALTVKGDLRMISRNNLIHVDTRGIEPYLTKIEDWKSTGFHMNRSSIFGGANPNSSFLSSHDTMFLIGGENVGTTPSTQAQMAGYLFYDLQVSKTNPLMLIHRTAIIEPHIHLEWNHDEAPPNPIAGISVWSSRMTVPRDFLTIMGGSITVRQTSTHTQAPQKVYGVLVDAEGANDNIDNIVRVLGTAITVENAKQNGEAYSLATDGPHDKIEADVYSDDGISEHTTGSITPASHKP